MSREIADGPQERSRAATASADRPDRLRIERRFGGAYISRRYAFYFPGGLTIVGYAGRADRYVCPSGDSPSFAAPVWQFTISPAPPFGVYTVRRLESGTLMTGTKRECMRFAVATYLAERFAQL